MKILVAFEQIWILQGYWSQWILFFKQKVNKEYPRNVLLLTDGAIINTDEVVSKIKKFNYSTRVHTFGIGSGASAYLVKETAKAGLGTSAMIADNDPIMNEKVIQALKIAAKSVFTDIKVNWNENSNAIIFQCPWPPITESFYEEESFDIYLILNMNDLVKSDIDLFFFNTSSQDRVSTTLHIDPNIIINVGDIDCTFKMTAKKYNTFKSFSWRWKRFINWDFRYFLKYSIMCDQTAFFGKIKNKEK